MGDLFLGILFGLLIAGLILLVSKPRPGQAVLLRPPPTSSPLIINIDGGVQVPGVYELPPQSRIQDAVEAAGGLLEHSSPGSVNLAAVVEDGAHIYIPLKNPDLNDPDQEDVVVLSPAGEFISLININQAPLEKLIELPGIGPVTAEKIIQYRDEKPFTRIDDIQNVPGIGPATFNEIKIYLTVGE